jgi:hypothetical protein
MKVTFRCKRSGNHVSFEYESDIAQMRKHEGYDEVSDEVKADSAVVEQPIQVQKPRGRPRKGN